MNACLQENFISFAKIMLEILVYYIHNIIIDKIDYFNSWM